MASDDFKDALKRTSEVDLTVTGRKSGQESTRPMWFVLDGDRLLLLPIHGTDTSWYRNIVKTPEIRLAADETEFRVTANTIEDPEGVADTVGGSERGTAPIGLRSTTRSRTPPSRFSSAERLTRGLR
jgi:hypothetical protein